MNDLDLMCIRVDTLFIHDARGRMICENEQEGRQAPHFFLGRTMDGYIVRFGGSLPDGVVRELAGVMELQPPLESLQLPPALVTVLRAVLDQHGLVTTEGGGPAYRFPQPVTQSPQGIQVTDRNIEALRDTYPWLYRDLAAWQPCFAVVRDGAAVSVCFSSRTGPDASEAGVETLPEFRGRGYAAAVSAAWGAFIFDSGRIPLYSTSWDNLASTNVARRVGLIMFGADATWT